ncbi:MAG: cohesin domain-containing protein [Anaerolineae bacterium]|jgi:uncharacterized repeat protein (TIGR01451 family)|nr:cohesin domain-containing protein [Anaerolineae bacterium]MDH7474579.1 cohesin domain-containing protein [Anaerolineae bacterium]
MKNNTFKRVALGLAVVLVAALVLGRYPQISKAVEVPQPGDPLQIQTSGPTTPLGIGDWYSSVTGDNTYHMLIIPVPDTYPATQDITIQLYDPECYNAGGQIYDEIRDAADTTHFLLLAPDGVTVVQDTTYAPAAATDQQWVVFATFNTATYGTGNYELRITTADNDDNTWRIRVDPDDPDGIPNGNEIGTPFMRITHQFDPPTTPPSNSNDHTFWFYVPTDWAQPTITLHNFDFDYPGLMTGDASLTYVSPSGIHYVGTMSGPTSWNDPSQGSGWPQPVPGRVGDTVPTEFGWWQIQLHGCYNNNQILVEVEGLPMYVDKPDYLAANVGLTKVRTTPSPVPVGGTVSFNVTLTNTGLTAITTLPLEDTYDPAYLDFQSASPAPDFVDEATGTLRWNNLAPAVGLVPGQSVPVTLNFTALASTAGGVTVNTATSSGAVDDNGHSLPEQTASDDVAIVAASFSLSKTRISPSPVPVGGTVSFNITITNNGETAITLLPLEDSYDPAYLDYVSASPAPNSVNETTGTLGWNNLAPAGGLLPGQSVTITLNFTALASTAGGVTINTATVSGAMDEQGQQLPEQTDSADVAIVTETEPLPRIHKSGTPSQAHIGDAVTFTLVARNDGNSPATGVQVTDQIESYLDITQVTTSKGTASWNNVSRLVTVDIGTLAPAEQVTIIIDTVVNETATPLPLTIENQAHLDFNEGEEIDSEIVIIEILEEPPEETVTPTPSPTTPGPAPLSPPPEIPEPLTLFLLGGGLMSLAGYATLRRRTG